MRIATLTDGEAVLAEELFSYVLWDLGDPSLPDSFKTACGDCDGGANPPCGSCRNAGVLPSELLLSLRQALSQDAPPRTTAEQAAGERETGAEALKREAVQAEQDAKHMASHAQAEMHDNPGARAAHSGDPAGSARKYLTALDRMEANPGQAGIAGIPADDLPAAFRTAIVLARRLYGMTHPEGKAELERRQPGSISSASRSENA